MSEGSDCRVLATGLALFLTLAGGGIQAQAADWSTTEAQFLYGDFANPFVVRGGTTPTFTTTLQHSSGWGFGDIFAFSDLPDPKGEPFNTYAEFYANFSLEGHIEYAGPRRDQFGNSVSAWVLGEPQLRLDLGKALLKRPDHLFLGGGVSLLDQQAGRSFHPRKRPSDPGRGSLLTTASGRTKWVRMPAEAGIRDRCGLRLRAVAAGLVDRVEECESADDPYPFSRCPQSLPPEVRRLVPPPWLRTT